MGKCLITKLQGVVNNDNLLKIGECRVYNSTSSSATDATFTISSKEEMTIVGHGLTIEGGSSYVVTASGDTVLVLSNTNGYAEIPNKHNLLGLKIGKNSGTLKGSTYIDLSCLEYANNLKELYISSDKEHHFGDIANLPALETLRSNETRWTDDIAGIGFLPSMKTLYLENSDYIHGSIASIVRSKFPKLETLLLVNNIGITGSISDLGSLTTLTTLSVAALSAVIGDISDLASRMVANGRTSGTLSVTGTNSGVTHNGESFTKKTITFNSSVSNGYTIE